MMERKFLVVVASKEMVKLKVKNVNFLFPVKDFSVGFLNTYQIEEIQILESYLYINRIFDCQGIRELEELLKRTTKYIKGICFTDLGVLNLVKKLNLSLELIYMQSHNTTNVESINYYLEYVDSVLVSTDITKEEILTILEHAKKPLVVPFFSLVDAMYSRRTLLNNYQNHFGLPKKQEEVLTEEGTKKEFIAIENDYGTVLYAKKFIDYREIEHPNIYYSFINPMHLSTEEVEKIINYEEIDVAKDTGFLHQETYYRLKGEEQ